MIDRIMDMLTSADAEMVQLGIELTLSQGSEWCKSNLPYFGDAGSIDYNTHVRSSYPVCMATTMFSEAFTRHGIGIYIDSGGTLYFRYLYQFGEQHLFKHI